MTAEVGQATRGSKNNKTVCVEGVAGPAGYHAAAERHYLLVGPVVSSPSAPAPDVAPTTSVGAYEWTSWVCVRLGVGPYTGPFEALHPQQALKRQICIVLKVVSSPCTKRSLYN